MPRRVKLDGQATSTTPYPARQREIAERASDIAGFFACANRLFPDARTLSTPVACAVSDDFGDALRDFCLEVAGRPAP
jgi:hypothetical protein